MFLLLPAIALGIIAGFVRGGDLSRLAHFPIRLGWLVIVSFLIQISIFTSWFPWLNLRADFVPVLHIASLALLLLVVLANRSLAGMKVLGLGLLLNSIVIIGNGGFMPVSVEAMRQVGLEEEIKLMQEQGRSAKGVLMTSETRFDFLGDRWYIDLPVVRTKIFSIGDVFIALGAFILVSQAMVRRRRSWNWH